jgi:hypothetical protein
MAKMRWLVPRAGALPRWEGGGKTNVLNPNFDFLPKTHFKLLSKNPSYTISEDNGFCVVYTYISTQKLT